MPRILVADDNSNIQKMVVLAFQDHGIEVVSVGNGEAAVRRMPDLIPDVVLADVFMPVRNGYELCEFIKKDSRFAKIPVILLVGAFDPLDEAEARRVGADGILKKPFVPPEPLIAMVTAVMAKAPKPEPKAAAPAIEIPKPPPPPPPPAIESFPGPAPEEETYAFGTGRRSLDDDEGGSVGTSTKTLVTPAAAASTSAVQSVEEDAGLSETGADWRRRDQVDSAAVPSFAPALIDEFTEQNLSQSEVEMASLEVEHPAETKTEAQVAVPEAAAEVPAQPEASAPAETQPELPTNESFLRAITGAFNDTAAAIEEAGAVPRKWRKPLEDSFQSTKGLTDLMGPALAKPTEWKASVPTTIASAHAEAPSVEQTPAHEVEASSPATETAKVAEPAESAPPPLSSIPLTVEAAPAVVTQTVEAADALPWEALRSPGDSAVLETPATAAIFETETVAVEAQVAEVIAAAPAASAPEAVAQASEPEIEEPEILPAPVEILESATIIARELGRAPVSEAPVADLGEPDLSPAAPVTETAAPTPEPVVEATVEPAVPEVVVPAIVEATPVLHNVEAVAEPVQPSDVAAQPTAAPPSPPNVDEVVAKVLEKLGPQLQELLSKNLVRPLVEDLLQKPDAEKK